MSNPFDKPSAPKPQPRPPVVPPKRTVQPRKAIRESDTAKPRTRTRRRAGAGGGGASLTGTILTGGYGSADGATSGRKSLLGD